MQTRESFVLNLLCGYGLLDMHEASRFIQSNQEMITRCFMYKTIPENNALLKWHGDATFKVCVFNLINLKHSKKKIVNKEWLTIIEQYIEKEKFLPKKLSYLGITKHVILGEQTLLDVQKYGEKFYSQDGFMEIITSVYKALLGLMKLKLPLVLSTAVSINMFNNLVDEVIDLPLNPLIYKSKKMALQELYHHQKWAQFNNEKPGGLVEYDEIKTDTSRVFVCRIFAFVLGDRRAVRENRFQIAEAKGKTKIEANEKACNIALNTLSKNYNLTWVMKQTPYEY